MRSFAARLASRVLHAAADALEIAEPAHELIDFYNQRGYVCSHAVAE